MRARQCLLLDQYGLFLGVSGDRLELRQKGGEAREVALEEVEGVVLGERVGGVSLAALRALAEAGVGVSLLGAPEVSVTPRPRRGLEVLRAQVKWSEGRAPLAARLSRRALLLKVRNQRHGCQKLLRSAPRGERGALEGALEELRGCEGRLKAEGLAGEWGGGGVEARLRSEEARAARAWWGAVGAALPAGFGFRGRAQAGEEACAFNAALNYGYAILVARVTQALGALGFEPQLGFFHVDSPPRASLSYDVVECYRQPFVDWPLLMLARERGAAWELDPAARLTAAARREVAGVVLGGLSEERSWGVGMRLIERELFELRESALGGGEWRPRSLRF